MVSAQEQAPSSEQQIRDAIKGFADAVRARNIEQMMSYYARDVVAFDLMPPLKLVGREAYQRSWEMGLSMMEGDIVMETKDLDIRVGGNVAYAHALSHMKAASKEGPMDNWLRWSACFEKRQGKWLVTHEHTSWPIDMESGKALMELKP